MVLSFYSFMNNSHAAVIIFSELSTAQEFHNYLFIFIFLKNYFVYPVYYPF